MPQQAMNEQVRAERGVDGTIVVLAAWCPTCQQEAQPTEEGACTFCDTPIVDFDTLRVGDLIRSLRPPSRPRGEVIPLRPEQPATLNLADGLALPVEAAGEAIAILAKRGAGKTNTGRVLAEELAAAGVQVVIVDPIGVWWGIRAGADGERAGVAIPILGGPHGDRDLRSWQGAHTARVVVDTGTSLLLDLSEMSKDEQRSFVADFAEELYAAKRTAQSLTHVILEEADEFAPERTRGGGGDPRERSRMRAAVETLARRGRSRGIGITMITQRSAGLSKDVLTQADVLIAMRTTGPPDLRSIDAWIDRHAAEGAQVVASLPALQTGEGWVWNPERDLLARVHFRLAATFDSSSTPKFGQPRREPSRLADVQLPLGADADEPPPPGDYRVPDDDGMFGCKTEGCDGRSASRAGPYAFLCDRCKGFDADPDRETPAPAKIVQRSLPAPAGEPVRSPLQVMRDFEFSLRDLFGLHGDFAADAAKCRREAERLRVQADQLERIAGALDVLAETQAELEDEETR